MYNKNAWNKYNEKEKKVIFEFNDGYKKFITNGKTERLCVNEAVKLLEEKGFVPLKNTTTLKPGDKVYETNKFKNVVAYVIGEKNICERLHQPPD